MGVYINKGYVLEYCPNHHYNKKGMVRQHRLVWERNNNAMLLPWADIHHINGILTDNRIENLIALSHSSHTIKHNTGSKHSEETKRKIGLKSIGRDFSNRKRKIKH